MNIISGSSVTITNGSISVNGGHGTMGSGCLAERTVQTQQFNGISSNGPIDVIFEPSPHSSVVVVCDDNLHEHIIVRTHGNTLQVFVEGSFRTENRILVKCTSPYLRDINLKGSGDITVSDPCNSQLSIFLQGSGDITIDNGECDELTVYLQGSGDVDTQDLKVKSARLRLQGSGDIRAHCTDYLVAELVGSGDIKVTGKPTEKHISEKGSGRIKVK